jgi:hypothetical protein
MSPIDRSRFLRRQSNQSLSVDELQRARRLFGVDVKRADHDGDGQIHGADEAAALWDEATAPAQNGLGAWGLHPGQVVRDRVAALDSFSLAAERRAQVALSGDTLAREGVVQHGPARGEPLDTTKARPAVRLSEAERLAACAKAGLDPATVGEAFANFSHDGRFFTALVPRDAVENVYLLTESFSAPLPAAHTMLRFQLAADKPVTLVPQDGQGAPRTLGNLVFSAEALAQPNWQYDLLAGQQGHYQLVGRFESVEDRFAHVESSTPAHQVEQVRLTLRPEQRHAMLAEAVRTSDTTGLEATYNTLNRSCATEAFAVIDRVLADELPVPAQLATALLGARVPMAGRQYLSLRGLVPDGGAAPTLNDELRRR